MLEDRVQCLQAGAAANSGLIELVIDYLQAIAEVGRQLADGHLLPSQAAALCGVLEHYRRHFEVTELEERIAALEAVSA